MTREQAEQNALEGDLGDASSSKQDACLAQRGVMP